MRRKRKKVDPIPKTFKSYEQAGEFWDTHDTTDYPDNFTNTNVQVQLKGRRFEIEIDADVMELLSRKARKSRTKAGRLANRLLRKELITA